MAVNNSNVSHKVGAAAINISETLIRLNAEEAIRRLPVVIFILILMIIGVFGNLHVLYIYYRKFNVSTYRIFVLSLAAIDIISCCVSMPFEIADELNPYIFKAEIACKIFRFLNTCLAMATSLMLVVIASERYRRICKPYGNQMTEKTITILANWCCLLRDMCFTSGALRIRTENYRYSGGDNQRFRMYMVGQCRRGSNRIYLLCVGFTCYNCMHGSLGDFVLSSWSSFENSHH